MASMISNLFRPDASELSTLVAPKQTPSVDDARLYAILASIDESLLQTRRVAELIEILEDSKRTLFELLRGHFPLVTAKLLSLKAINICLAKKHFRARNTTVLSRPFGLILDPSNSCNLACPGCVHSQTARERKVFQWGTGLLPLNRLSRFLATYGPYVIHANFCNYGEPLVNPETPRFIREAKGYLVGTMLSTNLSLPRLNAEALVASGLDYMLVSIDGATQPVYERFRRKGHLDVVVRNLERLVQAKREQGRRTPVIVWRMLTFEHNMHEIPLAAETARQLGLDQFTTATPYDVTWDDKSIRVAHVDTVNRQFNKQAPMDIVENWNPFPDALNDEIIEREFDEPWVDPAITLPEELAEKAGPGPTCHWLYKSISMDADGRMFPCCASPRPDADLVFSEFDGTPAMQNFNSEKYRLSRLAFVDMQSYQRARSESQLTKDPYCARCDWDKEATNTKSANINTYFQGASRELFNRQSLAVLSDW